MAFRSKAIRFTCLAAAAVCAITLSSWVYRDDWVLRSNLWDNIGGSGKVEQEGNLPKTRTSNSFDWLSIPPTKDLRWLPCFERRECARLLVPMDHDNPGGKQAALAMIRIPSPLGADNPFYLGPILFNPGGPGGSGVEQLANPVADSLLKILGYQFELVSFDPRGVAASVPHASFYKSSIERLTRYSEYFAAFTRGDVPRAWALAKIINTFARENDNGDLRYINTEQTARDMLSIVHAYGREKLQYWGFSYGTVLGATFAAMFPDKIERLVLDGVVDAEEYYSGMWTGALTDAAKVYEAFASECYKAGPTDCHFWAPSSTAIQQNITRLREDIRRQPLSVTTATGLRGMLDIGLLDFATFMTLYKPHATFSFLADAYAALAKGDGSMFLSLVDAFHPGECPVDSPTASVDDAQVAILCNDGDLVPPGLEWMQKYAETMNQSFPTWGSLLIGITTLNCVEWPTLPKAKFRGPFNATTSYPLLVVGNTADPVTPLASARKMSAGFTNSVLLTQDSLGHCSSAAPSFCTQWHIRKYFTEGILPDPGTICPVDTTVFRGKHVVLDESEQKVFSSLSVEERHIYNAAQELSSQYTFKPLQRSPFRGIF